MRVSRAQTVAVGIGIAGVLAVAACGGTSGQSTALAKTQILRFPVFQNPGTWDPGLADAEVDTELNQNVFDNLWQFDHSLNIIPDIATTVPSQANGGISSDGLTYTVSLKHNVKFDNGDPVTAKDVLYSWNRAAALQGGYSGIFANVAGFSAVQTAAGAPTSGNFQQNIETQLASKNPSFEMSGLTAPDGPNGYTVQIKLSAPCGWCLSAWALQGSAGAIVDENVIKNDPVNWWSKPGGPGITDGLVGTGAYYLAAFTPKQSIVFKQVPNWWGTPKPTLTEVDLDIKDPATIGASTTAWEQGSYDLIGYGGDSALLTYPLIQGIKSNSRFASQLLTLAKGRTTWVSFNIGYPSAGGPFLTNSVAAKGLREALDLAVDKQGLVSTVCHDILCTAATGGLITKGLTGYLGDGADPLAKFDPTTAKALLKKYDPSGSLTANLVYSYNTGGLNDGTATYLQSQWKTNLGINVSLNPVGDTSQFIMNRLGGTKAPGKYMMSRDGWQFDYNHPQDWFDNLWGAISSSEQENTSGFDDPTYDSILTQADQEPISTALPKYMQLAKILQQNWVYIPLYYSQANFAIHSYVKGAGSTTQADYYWDGISILQH